LTIGFLRHDFSSPWVGQQNRGGIAQPGRTHVLRFVDGSYSMTPGTPRPTGSAAGEETGVPSQGTLVT
jgi:hypothetical protein